ncbi:Pvc16 family protein [Leptolyngbya sp. AN02str]|uniref:Pvc16 family protein n=1 Tax=Leptolyngbya sp. AN02str TaxID=3423363 RepID=UPI003D3127F9
MIPAIAQAVANILVSGTSLTDTEQIDFGYPGLDSGCKPYLNLYLYEIQETPKPYPPVPPYTQTHPTATAQPLHWFNAIFVLTARDHTTLGEHHLLSESLTMLLQHPCIPTAFLSPAFKHYGELPLSVAPMTLMAQSTFWSVIGIPLQPALQIIVAIPFEVPTLQRPSLAETHLPHAPP